ncbi:ABC transporter substrate-binding protein [Paractinoplanes rishiriensis]|uniref:Thiamine biosynthesis protein n=1 Tax=Paractinoplanes rishiriensis TaxID=1050105 RepID=A0A919MYQ9_9ACTN|nr:ABC transporter substrate-binding protein [Actinoplanes rishiriensis]GIF00509.1 thiamine biosynthesis protein [Actinoplanes rishiriensis]
MAKTRLISLLLVAALAVTTAACGDDNPEGAAPGGPDQVKVGVIPILDVAPIYLGKEQGFFAKQNIELTMEQAQGGAAIVPAVVSGQYQFGFSNVASLLLGTARNVPVKVVANGVNSTSDKAKDFGMLVVKDPAITSAKQLEGKTVATNTLRNIVHLSVNEIVRQAGGDPAKVKFVEVPFPDMAAALESDRVQAMFVVEPFLSAGLSKGWKTIGALADVAPNLCVAVYFASTQTITGNPDLVKRFTTAMQESLAYANANPDAVRTAVTTYTTIKAEAAAKLTLPKWPSEIDRPSIDRTNQLLVTDGFLPAPADTGKLLP